MRPIDADILLNKYVSNRDKGNILIAQTDYAQGARDIIEGIIDAPTIEPEQKKGKWFFNSDPRCGDFICSECLERNIVCTNYCPNCGAEMGER